jgi:hypothetical protein
MCRFFALQELFPMRLSLAKLAGACFRHLGVELAVHDPSYGFTGDEPAIVRDVEPYTMTSPQRICALIDAVEYIVRNDIPGGIVECGVWKGGSVMAVAKTLQMLGRSDREIYLFDTFEGMSPPGDRDVSYRGDSAAAEFQKKRNGTGNANWCDAPLEEVRQAVFSTGYDESRFHFVKGKVEDTVPDRAPESIALLRLDTDWYESTRHELVHLFPRISRGGVLIIDDYGYWKGARQAVDEYVAENKLCLLLNRIDQTGRIAVKQ